MIEAIELENIQNIKSAIIEPHPRFNIIVGTSDHGKSAIIRGAKFAIRNDSDIDLINWDAKRGEGCSVAIQFDDGFIVRFKSKSKNYYTTSVTEGTLEAFRKGLPEDVESVTRMNDINIKSQDDPYLFFQKSPGEVARMLNKAVGNEAIDIYFKRVDKIISDTKRRKASIEEDIEENQKNYDLLGWVNRANEDIEKVQKLFDSVDAKKSKIEELKTIIDVITENEEILDEIKDWLTVENIFLSVKSKLDKYLELKSKFEELNGILKKYYAFLEKQKALKDVLEMEDDAKHVLSLIKNVTENKQRIVQIKNALKHIESLSGRSEMLRIRAKKLKERYNQTLIEIEICPICGQSTRGLKGG